MRKIIGGRIKSAREASRLSQGDFAKAVGLSAEYISLLEKGKRTPRFETLQKIAAFLNKDISFFFKDREPGFGALLGDPGLDPDIRQAVVKFRRYCERYLGHEDICGRHLDLAPAYGATSPDRMADEERRRLGIGREPIRDIFALCESNGCRIFRHPLPGDSRVSAIFVFIREKNAAFAMINSLETPVCRMRIAAHVYAHFLKDRYEAPIIDKEDVFVDEYVTLYSPREASAQAFALRFLVPPDKVADIMDRDLKVGRCGFEDVLYLKRYFGVSFRDMLRVVKNLGGLPGSRFEEYFQRDEQAREKEIFNASAPGGRRGSGRETRFPGLGRSMPSDRFKLLASEARSLHAKRQPRLIDLE